MMEKSIPAAALSPVAPSLVRRALSIGMGSMTLARIPGSMPAVASRRRCTAAVTACEIRRCSPVSVTLRAR